MIRKIEKKEIRNRIHQRIRLILVHRCPLAQVVSFELAAERGFDVPSSACLYVTGYPIYLMSSTNSHSDTSALSWATTSGVRGIS